MLTSDPTSTAVIRATAGTVSGEARTRPNIVFVLSDQHRARTAGYRRHHIGGGPSGHPSYGSDYAACANHEVLLMVQIETAQAAERAEDILSVEGSTAA